MATATGIILGAHVWFVGSDRNVQGKALSGSMGGTNEAASFIGAQASGSVRLCLEPTSLNVERRNMPAQKTATARGVYRKILNLTPKASLAFSKPVASGTQGVRAWLAWENDGYALGLRDSLTAQGVNVIGGWPVFALMPALAKLAPVPNGTAVVMISPSFAACAFVRGGVLTEYVPHHFGEEERTMVLRTIIAEWIPTHDGAPVVLACPEPDWAAEAFGEMWTQLTGRQGVMAVGGDKIAAAIATLAPKDGENMLYDTAAQARKVAGVLFLTLALGSVVAAGWFGVTGFMTSMATPRIVAQLEARCAQAREHRRVVEERRTQIALLEQGVSDPKEFGATGSAALLRAMQVQPPENLLVATLEVSERQFRCETLWYPPLQVQYGADVRGASQDAAKPEDAASGGAARDTLTRLRQRQLQLRPVVSAPAEAAFPGQNAAATTAAAQAYAASLVQAGYNSAQVLPPGPASVGSRWTNAVVITGKL